jgi:hypothetical protein
VAIAIEAAVAHALDDGLRTADLLPPSGSGAGTTPTGTLAMTQAIVDRIEITQAARTTVAAEA